MNKENGYSPSYFLAMSCPKQSTSADNHSYHDFFSIAKVKPDISVATRSFIIHLVSSSATRIAVDHKNRVTLVLHGEIYNTRDNQAEFLIEQYIEYGIAFVGDVNGSFSVLLIDKRNDTVALITDRINSRKVFYSKYKGSCWLSTSLYLHPTTDVNIDPIGIACYLANGFVCNNRTLFDGIRILERACVHKLTEEGFHATRYWFYEFSNAYSNMDEKKLRVELSELLVESVRIRLNDHPKVFLSLSGGYDSAGILGVLGSKLNVPNVDCFSYALGEPKPDSDEYVAREMANYLGFNHKIFQSYKGNLLNVINLNADLGQGLAYFGDDADSWTEQVKWMEMANEFSVTAPSVLFVGDKCFGMVRWSNRELNSYTDVLDSVRIYDFNGLSWLQYMLDKNIYETLYDGLREERLQIIKHCPPTEDYLDSKDFLYLEEELSHAVLPGRDFIQAQFVIVRNPWLDNSILDFMRKIPSSLRRGKCLYKETIAEMFPGLFQFERAHTSSYTPNWGQEFSSHRREIESLISSQDNKLDMIIPPQVILQLLREDRMRETSRFFTRALPIKIARRLLSRTSVASKISRIRLANKIWNRFRSQYFIDHATFLQRILVIRSFLSKN